MPEQREGSREGQIRPLTPPWWQHQIQRPELHLNTGCLRNQREAGVAILRWTTESAWGLSYIRYSVFNSHYAQTWMEKQQQTYFWNNTFIIPHNNGHSLWKGSTPVLPKLLQFATDVLEISNIMWTTLCWLQQGLTKARPAYAPYLHLMELKTRTVCRLNILLGTFSQILSNTKNWKVGVSKKVYMKWLTLKKCNQSWHY